MNIITIKPKRFQLHPKEIECNSDDHDFRPGKVIHMPCRNCLGTGIDPLPFCELGIK